MEHMNYEYCVQRQTHGVKAPGPAQMNAELKKFTQARAAAQERFEKLLGRDLDLKFWNTAAKTAGVQWAAKSKRSAFVEIMRGRAGHKVPIVTSRLNLGRDVSPCRPGSTPQSGLHWCQRLRSATPPAFSNSIAPEFQSERQQPLHPAARPSLPSPPQAHPRGCNRCWLWLNPVPL